MTFNQAARKYAPDARDVRLDTHAPAVLRSVIHRAASKELKPFEGASKRRQDPFERGPPKKVAAA